VASAVHMCVSLRVLNLYGTQASDSTAAALAGSLLSLPPSHQLQYVLLGKNGVQSTGAKALLAALRQRSLEYPTPPLQIQVDLAENPCDSPDDMASVDVISDLNWLKAVSGVRLQGEAGVQVSSRTRPCCTPGYFRLST
jgi:hypothetical protein